MKFIERKQRYCRWELMSKAIEENKLIIVIKRLLLELDL